jgi:antitoxin (DNA-binding transcriptional repressor) of toxin-antitoxin stability system
VLPKGTPVAQCIPVKRESWSAEFSAMSPEQARKLGDNANRLARETDVYRQHFRAGKR